MFGGRRPLRFQSIWQSKANLEIKSIFSFTTNLYLFILLTFYGNKILGAFLLS